MDTEQKNIVVRYQDGSLIKGTSRDFSPDKQFFHITPQKGKPEKIDIQVLKAVFFVRDLSGDSERKDRYKDMLPWEEKKVKVRFNDGEEITGYVMHYAPGPYGFFLTPADRRGNNQRIFVVTAATKEILYL